MDPNFGVLVGEDENQENGGKKNNKMIIIAVPVTIGIVIILALSACFIIPRYFLFIYLIFVF